MRAGLIVTLGILTLALAGCGNTAQGLKRDGQDGSRALDDASNRILSNGAK